MGRIEPIGVRSWPPEMRAAMAAYRTPNPRHPFPAEDPDRPKGLNALGVLAHHPALATAYHHLVGHALFGTTLTPRQRELLVLRVAHRRQATYEWAQHVYLAAEVGISAGEVDLVKSAAPAAAGWSAVEGALLRAADELLDDARISDPTWADLSAELDEQQIMDAVFTVGAYDVLAMALRTFEVPIDDDLAPYA
ncbi:MAG TPA: carboxymuconolactone decarboxylase family protein [Acidimicrobiales bacterium]|jgi:alkylhydroperoxidase family enzyme|nr:carboxymuconolactone decarboxylase family protein [Acidimicrobiales bacterium]